jgi:hypothetical protein
VRQYCRKSPHFWHSGEEGKKMDELEQFCANFLKQQTPMLGAVPFVGAVSMVENVTSILLYRQGQFQVQMFAAPAGTVIPEHTHPNVDNIQVYVGGNIRFSHSGKYIYPEDALSRRTARLALPAVAAWR